MGHRQNLTRRQVIEDLAASQLDVATIQQLLGSADIVRRVEVEGGRANGVHSTPTWSFTSVLWDRHYDRATLLAQARGALEAGP